MICKYCGAVVNGKGAQMANHVKWGCAKSPKAQAYQAHKNDTPVKPPFDPVAVVESLDADVINKELVLLEKRQLALRALLTVVQARDKV